MGRRLVDLSHPIVAGMTTSPGLPAPEIETYISRAQSAARLVPGVSFHIGRLSMVANTGTYMDAPFHFHEDGADTAGLSLESLVDLPVVVVDARPYVGELLRTHLPKDDPLASYADRLTGKALGGQPLKGYLSGSVDAVLRIGDRYVVVDYKTNWLGDPSEPLTAADYAQPRLAEAMLHSDYPLQALLYCVVLHRFLRWRQPGYSPEQHLGGVLYLFVRGMCGAQTPIVDGHPAGVFSWRPPAPLIVAMSDLLDAGAA